ncbi:hypothetical protein GDO78_019674 [Eleutherodactylus coqui]|uniref:Uncharacterized protein n=1 Tax=Eleutherodactylus coqui TaxID=57060 RepID=A0A8J6EAP2_ELECQ|nr:hypothetical protein GDO78_019674 [Eleutherodactylus coqui]
MDSPHGLLMGLLYLPSLQSLAAGRRQSVRRCRPWLEGRLTRQIYGFTVALMLPPSLSLYRVFACIAVLYVVFTSLRGTFPVFTAEDLPTERQH